MTIQKLKSDIESNNLLDTFLVLQYSDNNFLPTQYIHEIIKRKNLSIEYVSDLESLISTVSSMFYIQDENLLNVYYTDSFEYTKTDLFNVKNLIIVTNKIGKETKDVFKNSIVSFPKIEDWQIKDYVYSILENIGTKKLDWLIKICNNDIYRIDKEINKIKIFSKEEQDIIFNQCSEENMFDDLTEYNVFNLVNAVTTRNIDKIKSIYLELKNIDFNSMGFFVLMYNNFKSIINVQLSINPSAESLGMNPKQFYAVKCNTGYFNQNQLIKLFKIITDIDRQIKTGELPVDKILDYLLINILVD